MYTWGDGRQGALGYPPSVLDREPRKVNLLLLHSEKIRKVYCGARHTMFLSTLGRIYGCGDNEHGQLGLTQKKSYVLP